jgi:8-oxo-dGTP diphosphatase
MRRADARLWIPAFAGMTRCEMQKGKDYIGVGTGAFILKEPGPQLLLVKRVKQPEAGTWSIPGGALEFGETFEAAIKREVKEETGLDVEIVKLLRVTDHILPEEGLHWVTPAFLCKITDGEARNLEPKKHSDIAWFPLDALPEELTMTTTLALGSYLET